MMYLSIILLPICVILIFIIKKKNDEIESERKKKKEIEQFKLAEIKEHFREEWNKSQTQFNLESNKLESEIKVLKKELTEKEKRYSEVNQDLDLYRKGKMEEIDRANTRYKEHQETLIRNELDKYREDWTKAFNEDLEKLSETRVQKLEELEEIKNELEEERTKRAAINKEILRQREVEEQQDFYRIQLDPLDKPDIEILRDTAARLRRPEAINKIIWSGYYQKPLAELRKRLLTSGDVSGVYKITRLKTGEIYIGQSTSVDKRWQEHVKTALGVGTLTSSLLHRRMAEDGCENFLFELIEEVPKDKLRERESYYIDFYDTKAYGLNSLKGDKNAN